MAVSTQRIELSTRGSAEMVDITEQVQQAAAGSGLKNGIVLVFCPGSTGALTTIEYEPGALADLTRLFDEILPPDRDYLHDRRWGDGNGHSHVRAALLGPDISVPLIDGALALGTWQQLIFVDFDNRPRRRHLIVQITGE